MSYPTEPIGDYTTRGRQTPEYLDDPNEVECSFCGKSCYEDDILAITTVEGEEGLACPECQQIEGDRIEALYNGENED